MAIFIAILKNNLCSELEVACAGVGEDRGARYTESCQ